MCAAAIIIAKASRSPEADIFFLRVLPSTKNEKERSIPFFNKKKTRTRAHTRKKKMPPPRRKWKARHLVDGYPLSHAEALALENAEDGLRCVFCDAKVSSTTSACASCAACFNCLAIAGKRLSSEPLSCGEKCFQTMCSMCEEHTTESHFDHDRNVCMKCADVLVNLERQPATHLLPTTASDDQRTIDDYVAPHSCSSCTVITHPNPNPNPNQTRPSSSSSSSSLSSSEYAEESSESSESSDLSEMKLRRFPRGRVGRALFFCLARARR